MSIADKITQLTTIRASMREKLVAKGVDASTHNFADFPNDVENIPSGGNLNVGEVVACEFDFLTITMEVN